VQRLAGRAGFDRRLRDAEQDRIVPDALQPDVDAELIVRAGEPASLRMTPVLVDEHHLAQLMLIGRVVAAPAPLVAGVHERASGARDLLAGSRNRVRRLRRELAAVDSALRVNRDASEDGTFAELIARERPRPLQARRPHGR